MDTFETQQLQLDTFPGRFKSIVLATIGDKNSPHLSYAPMIYLKQRWIILISAMAPHTRNLIEHGVGSGLLVEDESAAASIFFRKRLSFDFKATPLTSTPAINEAFTLVHGEMVPMLLKMDFQFWELFPAMGTFVCGPGQAYTVDNKLKIMNQNGRPGGHNK